MINFNVLATTFSIEGFLEKVNSLVWGAPLLILLVGTGVYLTVKLGLLQIFNTLGTKVCFF